MRTARRTPVIALVTALAAVLTACTGSGEPDPADSEAAGPGYPVTVTDVRGEVTIEAEPRRVVSLSPSVTEMLFGIGAGDQVVAADEYSDYPDEAPTTDLSGFTPSVEAISTHDPDLVILAREAQKSADQLEKLDIPVLVMPAAATLDDTYAQMRMLGKVTGHPDKADTAADRVESEVDRIVADTREKVGDSELTYYHELDDAMYSVTSDTFIGDVYDRFGLENIADATDDKAGGYPQLSPEFVVEQDPDLIFLGYGGGDAAASVRERPAFDTVTAVREDNVVPLDPDVSSRWGPRVTDLAESVSEAVVAAEES